MMWTLLFESGALDPVISQLKEGEPWDSVVTIKLYAPKYCS